MAANSNKRAAFKAYPHLTRNEFAEVCHYLDAKYCQAPLGNLRSKWRLNVHTALATGATSRAQLATFLQITVPIDNSEVEVQLAKRLHDVNLRDPAPPPRRSRRLATKQPTTEADQMMIDSEEADKEVLRYSSRATFQSGYVVYEIHLHPTYQAPCLWFSLHNLPIDESPLDMDTVFRRLVPDPFKSALLGQGAIGGISIEHHPLTGVPTFFVHPCFLGDAMGNFDCSKEDYLTIWLGLVGGCVGLWVPKEMAMGPGEQPAQQEQQ
ncbi:hypothetical protein GGR50DRAFT_350844 [Xylaria sp. CBS 124048]|nr:hypothetical protein GGR50DRAFT_350844 [Xylaria sp. CBS 124048]